MSKSKKHQSSLGRTLVNSKRKDDISRRHTSDIFSPPQEKLRSVIDQSSLKEFLMEAELSAKNFEALKGIKIQEEHRIIDLNDVLGTKPKPKYDDTMIKMKVPRRPKWDTSTTPEQLMQMENDNFLSWRRDLAHLEEELLIDKTMTPFEKNIEVWKQLWRVIEKSDIVVQIVDGRNPLFFRCPDLEKYVKEVDTHKYNILLVNKSDLLSEEIRKCWSDHFNKHGLNHIFFSAKTEQEKIDSDKIEEDEAKPEDPKLLLENTPEVFTRKNLLIVLKNITSKIKLEKWAKEPPQEDQVSKKAIPHADVITIGMVGYPNVGKSSVINVLCKKKLVGVAAMPGKTKHFQTIFIEKDLMLCDCPGLVFPNFTSTRAEMVANGVLPIDTLKDWTSPVQYVVGKTPKEVFETIYKITIEFPKPTASQVLQAFARQRGYKTGRDLPDEAKVARVILKDLVNGKVLCCALPPDYDKAVYGEIITHNPIKIKATETKPIEEDANNEEVKLDEKDILDNDEKIENYAKIEGEFFEDNKPEEDPFEGMDNEDVLMIMLEGKELAGYKLNKQQRRDIKFALKRGDTVDIRRLLLGAKYKTGAKSLGKFASDNFIKAEIRLTQKENTETTTEKEISTNKV